MYTSRRSGFCFKLFLVICGRIVFFVYEYLEHTRLAYPCIMRLLIRTKRSEKCDLVARFVFCLGPKRF